MNPLKFALLCSLIGTVGLFPREVPQEQDVQSGRTIFKQMNCGMCHGSKLQGSLLAPPLTEVGKGWTREELALYLKNPSAYIETNERLKKMKKEYSKVSMPSFESISAEQRELLITFLLSQK